MNRCFLIAFNLLVSFSTIMYGQDQQLRLSKEQAIEDFNWLRFALEYCYPGLYKYEDKKTVDARFDSISNLIANPINGLDFLSLVTKMNASLHSGHLYTIPQNQLEKEVLDKKVLPFYLKILNNKIYL